MILLDNIRGRLASAVIEAKSLSPVVSFRILGQSATIERPNTYLWAVTANGTEATSDLISRSLPIRLYFEGDPRKRNFSVDVIEYAQEHRIEILGELLGLVQRWLENGKSVGNHRHRCHDWASIIGGILDVAGLGRWFLANAEEARAEMDAGLRELTALAEHILKRPDLKDLLCHGPAGQCDAGRVPADWAPLFDQARLLPEKLQGTNERSRATVVGQFLGSKLDRPVIIESESQTLELTLRKRDGRSRKKYYYFEVKVLDRDEGGPPQELQDTSSLESVSPAEIAIPAIPQAQPGSTQATSQEVVGVSECSGPEVTELQWLE
jgi:hypothetical protein